MSTWSDIVGVEGQYHTASWHSTFPVLAASTDGRVDLFTEDGRKIDRVGIKKDGLKCNIISWHPTRKLLASSWSNGVLVVWNDAEQTSREAIGHHSAITAAVWSPTGNRIVTGDAEGGVVVWRSDIRGRLTSICQYRLKSAVTHIVFRKPKAEDIKSNNETASFFLASANGSVFYTDDIGHCSEDIKSSTPIISLLMLEATDTLIVVNDDLILSQYIVSPEGKVTQQTEFKLSASAKVDKKLIQIDCAGRGVIALSSAARSIRLWDLISEDSFNLGLADNENIKLIYFAYNRHRNMIAASTENGQLIMWKKIWVAESDQNSVSWELVSKLSTGMSIKHLQWGSNGTFLVACTATGLSFFGEQTLCYSVHGTLAAVQISSNKILLSKSPNSKVIELNALSKIKTMALSATHLAVSNGTVVDIFEHSNNCLIVEPVGSFSCQSSFLCLDLSSVIVGMPQKVNICNYQGTVKQYIKLDESEGELTRLESNESFLVLSTSRFVVKLFDMSRREPRLLLTRIFDDLISIVSLKVNSKGTFLSLFVLINDSTRPEARSKMLLYNVDSDLITPVNFGGSHVSPIAQHWDANDSRILVCEVEGFVTHKTNANPEFTIPPSEANIKYREVFTMFATQENGILVQDHKVVTDLGETLIGVGMPFHFYLKKSVPKDFKLSDNTIIEKRTVRDFEGLEDADANTIKATIDFSFYLNLGNMDEAFKCINSIKNKSVWEHLAKICVKTKRLDVAMTCLSNIGNSHTIRAIREAGKEPEPEAQIGILAAYLGLNAEAEQILSSCNRYDILNRLYQANGQWEKALELSETKDRINLKTTYHKFGKHLSEIGDISGALAAFEKSHAYCFEIPKMLLSQVGELEKYINESEDKSFKRWWAQFAESQGDYQTAIKYYEISEDALSTVRVNCLCGNQQKAIEITQLTKNPAAAYHLARQFENDKKIPEAIAFYSTAKCFNHAIRLAKSNNMENELIHLALQGSKESMLEVARYYEGIPKSHDKAIHLFFKAGSVSRAIDLCFQTKQYGILADLAPELTKDTNPKVLRKVACFFFENGHYDKAVSLMVKGNQHAEALDICIQNNVQITDEMANEMTADPNTSKATIIRIAECCLQQRSFLLASKKYTQAGERMKAMKALLQSGDTEKIIFFANALGSKQKDIFVMVANYLQTLDWRSDSNVMRAIISFYTKAKALVSLATFYEACGQGEIDEYQNYEKGLAAMKEAIKCLTKAGAKNVGEDEFRIKRLQNKMELISKFLEARKMAKVDPTNPEWVAICEELLADRMIDDSVKSGDIYAMMIETHYATSSIEPASDLLQRMKKKVSAANIDYFLDATIAKAIDKEHVSTIHEHGDHIEEHLDKY